MTNLPNIIEKELIYSVLKKSVLKKVLSLSNVDVDSPHGFYHWFRVLERGLMIADQEDVDASVIIAFSFLHDAFRENDGVDLDHGEIAAKAINDFLYKNLNLDKRQIQVLCFACKYHSNGYVVGNLDKKQYSIENFNDKELNTVGACWDADRLDLARVGIYPDRDYLSTNTAKNVGIISLANKAAMNNEISDLGLLILEDIKKESGFLKKVFKKFN